MTKSFKRNPHKREELLRKLKPLIIKSIRKYYNDFSQYEDLLQQGYEVILSVIEEFDEEKDVNFLWFIKMKLKFYYLDKYKYRKEKPSSLNKPIGENGNQIQNFIPVFSDRFIQGRRFFLSVFMFIKIIEFKFHFYKP